MCTCVWCRGKGEGGEECMYVCGVGRGGGGLENNNAYACLVHVPMAEFLSSECSSAGSHIILTQ